MDQVLRNTSRALRVVLFVDEAPTDSSTAVTVTVTRDDGTAIATNAATTKPAGTTGTYEYILAAQANLDRLTLSWTGTVGGLTQTVTTQAEIVGAYYVTLADIRAQKNLDDTAKFTTAELANARYWFEDLCENYAGFPLVPRFARDTLKGYGSAALILRRHPRRLLSVLAGTTAETTTDWALDATGVVTRSSGTFSSTTRYTFRYEHGLDGPPQHVRDVALTAIRSHLLMENSGTRSRELSIRTEYGIVDIGQPDEVRVTGIPEVDSVLTRLRAQMVAIA